jgi:hypothetical protein
LAHRHCLLRCSVSILEQSTQRTTRSDQPNTSLDVIRQSSCRAEVTHSTTSQIQKQSNYLLVLAQKPQILWQSKESLQRISLQPKYGCHHSPLARS